MNAPAERRYYADNVTQLPQRGTGPDAPRTGYRHDAYRPDGNAFEPVAGANHAYVDAGLEPANSNTQPIQAAVVPFAPAAIVRPGPQYNPRGTAAAAVAVPDVMPPAGYLVTKFEPVAAEPDWPVQDWQREIGVVMTRVTETMTVPLSTQALLPPALMAAVAARQAAVQRDSSGGPALITATAETQKADEIDQTVTDFARRYVRQPGE